MPCLAVPCPCLAGVGKTCLLLRYANDSFSPTFITTIGIGEQHEQVDEEEAARPLACVRSWLLAGAAAGALVRWCADFKVKMVDVAGKKVKLQIVSGGPGHDEGHHHAAASYPHPPRRRLLLSLFVVVQWDTAGQERFRVITTSYFRGAQGIMLVYDVTDRASFMAVKNWVEEIDKNADKHVNRILIGNKCDVDEKDRVSGGRHGHDDPDHHH